MDVQHDPRAAVPIARLTISTPAAGTATRVDPSAQFSVSDLSHTDILSALNTIYDRRYTDHHHPSSAAFIGSLSLGISGFLERDGEGWRIAGIWPTQDIIEIRVDSKECVVRLRSEAVVNGAPGSANAETGRALMAILIAHEGAVDPWPPGIPTAYSGARRALDNPVRAEDKPYLRWLGLINHYGSCVVPSNSLLPRRGEYTAYFEVHPVPYSWYERVAHRVLDPVRRLFSPSADSAKEVAVLRVDRAGKPIYYEVWARFVDYTDEVPHQNTFPYFGSFCVIGEFDDKAPGSLRIRHRRDPSEEADRWKNEILRRLRIAGKCLVDSETPS